MGMSPRGGLAGSIPGILICSVAGTAEVSLPNSSFMLSRGARHVKNAQINKLNTKEKMNENNNNELVPVENSQLAAGQQMGLFNAPQVMAGGALAAVTSNAQVTQTLASIFIAKQFPRDLVAVTRAMNAACSRAALARQAMYSYPRGGTAVVGPSVRLADALLGAWGNAESGWKEVERHWDAKKNCNVSECVAFAFDKETNLKAEIAFSVPHVRDTKKGRQELKDERDIYELCANMSARRRRACILQVLPAWLLEEAVEKVNETLNSEDGGKPMIDRVRSMVAKFAELGVTKEQLETNLGHPIEETIREELIRLGQTYNALADGHVRVSDVFPREEAPAPAPKAPAKLAPEAASAAPGPVGMPAIGKKVTAMRKF